MRFGKWLIAALALCLIATTSVAAQQTGTITGRVTDTETGAALSAASIEVVSPSGRVVATGLTDQQGNFRIANVPVGTYSLVFMSVGHQTTRVPDVRVAAGETSMAGASLASAAFILNPVVISASKRQEKALEAPASVSVVSREEVENRPTVTPVDHLRSTPGVDVITTGVQSTNVVVRGFNNIFSGALHTLTDYRIAGVPSLRVNFMHFIPQSNDDIDRMEVVLGPGSALYGPNTANGVLHILTKSPLEDQATTVSVAGGEQDMFQANFRTSQKLSDRFGFKISGQYLKATEFLYRDPGEDSVRNALPTTDAGIIASPLFSPALSNDEKLARARRIANRDFDIGRWSGDVRADWRATENLTTVFSAGSTTDNSIELTGIGAGQAVDWRYNYAQARANYKSAFLQTYVNMSDAGDTYLLRNGSPITDKSKVWVSQIQNATNFGTRQSFTYGLDYIKTMPNTERTINGENEDTDNYDEFGAYIQSQTNLSRMFEVVLAGRYDKHSELEDAVFSPRAALVFKPTEDHNFRVTYNRAFSTPTSLNLFLDIDAGPLGALGPLGYRAHAQAPGRGGINLHASDGSLRIRTPFAGNPTDPNATGALRPISAQGIYALQVEAIRRAASLPASLAAYMNSLAADPTFGGIGVVLTDPLTSKAIPFSNSAVSDIAPIEESTTSTFEVGYKGILGDRLLLAADAWWSNHKNFTSPLITATPIVMMNPTALVQFLVPRLTPAILGSAPPGTITPAQAQAQATQIAMNMARIPGGVIASEQTNGASAPLILTYRNFGEVDLSGVDLSATALLSDNWQLGVTGSLVSDDFFNLPLGNGTDSTVVALNAPKKKATGTISYRNVTRGLNGEFRVRYTDEFPANSAGYVGLKCVDSSLTGECVKSYTLLDLSAGYRLPVRGASLQLSVSNLLDEDYQSFIGTPTIGRMAILRLRYDF